MSTTTKGRSTKAQQRHADRQRVLGALYVRTPVQHVSNGTNVAAMHTIHRAATK